MASWQALLGNAVLGVDSATFCSLRPALRWLLSDGAQAPRPLQWETGRVSLGGWFDPDLPARGNRLLDADSHSSPPS